ncbi:MAG: glycosyltransferase family 2 protein [Chlorobi bacterium]|nr:glycosyltransferase family 2 protein [Chlorobiota bacterium]
MGFADNYLNKNKLSVNITYKPENSLEIIVVIPAFNEPDLLKSLQALWNCKKTSCAVEVLIVFNFPENIDNEVVRAIEKQKKQAENWIKYHQRKAFRFFIIYKPDLPKKTAGVGLARKIGMDEAVIRFNSLNKPAGVIVNFDADSVCDINYLIEVENHFIKQPKTNGISIYFEHPVDGEEFPANMYEAIKLYELHLRYYKQALQFTGFPYYFHTVGSAFAVKADVYCKQGGMNRQKAGEDFYFLQKIIPLGNFYELNSTRVIPSLRVSDRVPFGTGAAMTHLAKQVIPKFETYNFKSFKDLKSFINKIDSFYNLKEEEILMIVNKLPESIKDFLKNNNFIKEVQRAKDNSSTLISFRKQFFQWFSAFRIIKFLNISHDSYYQKNDINIEAKNLLEKIKVKFDDKELISIYRKLDKGSLKM